MLSLPPWAAIVLTRTLTLNANKRHDQILQLLDTEGRLMVSDLAVRLDVSEMTIRRDFEVLEQSGMLSRVHGGAVPADSRSYEPPFAIRLGRNLAAKQRIGQAAAGLLRDGETVILDAGTTTLEVARALRGRKNLRIMALSLHIADLLVDEVGITTMLSGGVARPGERSFIGTLAEQTFRELSFDTVFLTVGGIDPGIGLTEYNLDDAGIKRAACASARRRIAVADSSKIGKNAFVKICAIDDLDILITDSAAPDDVLNQFRKAGVEVIVA
jgi:DeoR/GlpR family transcriptional regulator of sugar metabolism